MGFATKWKTKKLCPKEWSKKHIFHSHFFIFHHKPNACLNFFKTAFELLLYRKYGNKFKPFMHFSVSGHVTLGVVRWLHELDYICPIWVLSKFGPSDAYKWRTRANWLFPSNGIKSCFNGPLKFLTGWIGYLTSREVGGRGAFIGCISEECNSSILQKVTAVVGSITFYNENEWACDGDSDNTFHTSLQLSSCVCLNGLPTKYRLYLLKLVSIFGHFLTVNNRRYGRCYVKKIIPLTVYFPWILHSTEANSARSFQNAFCKCSRALNIIFLKPLYFWWISSFFSLSSHLNSMHF